MLSWCPCCLFACFGKITLAATLTGTGGGIVRDILASRKPMIFQSEIYAAWAFGNSNTFYRHCGIKDAVSEL
ncbi:TRIC cation channel family protein [Neobacillus mesonae]|uniref:TRIC cation channel family protein n=1 Tax=Neobacillus mesonae TaxID=1193713 RepID=UPI00288BF271|nr:TRIC cation channel family protein [Neobacillus mesonae]